MSAEHRAVILSSRRSLAIVFAHETPSVGDTLRFRGRSAKPRPISVATVAQVVDSRPSAYEGKPARFVVRFDVEDSR